jgi:uncharacterized membrane protein
MKTKPLIQGAVIASIYVVLTFAFAPISYGLMQVRISEALTVLPYFTPVAVPGLFVGCLVANVIGPYGILDMVFGSFATLLSAYLSYRLRKNPGLVPLPPVLVNGIVIGGLLHWGYGIPVSLVTCILWVSLGQVISCYGLGYPLLKILKRYEKIFV